MVNKEEKAMAIGVIILIGIVGIAGYYLMATESVGADEVGIRVNTWNQEVDLEKYYTGGRFSIGIMSEFVKYPTTVEEFNFADANIVSVRSNDGLQLHIRAWIQYQLDAPRLLETDGSGKTLYERYPSFGQLEGRMYPLSRTVINNIVSRYQGIDIYEQREIVEADVKAELDIEMDRFGVIFIDAGFRSVDFPNEFEEAQLQKKVAQEAIKTAEFELEKATVQAQTRVVQAEADAEVIRTNAYAQADAEVALMNKLNMTNDEYLELQYIWMLRELENPVVILNTGDAGTSGGIDPILFMQKVIE